MLARTLANGSMLLARISVHEQGQTMVEYGMLLAVIVIVVVVVAMIIGANISASFEKVIAYF